VWGTRSSLEFVELPSNLFEKFLEDYRVVQHFLKHVETGEPIPRDLFEANLCSRRTFSALDLQHTIVQCMFDQAVFSDRPMQAACSYLDPLEDGQQSRTVRRPASADEDPFVQGTSRNPIGEYDMTPSNVDSNALVAEVARRHSIVPHMEQSMWQAGFSHVVGYGAGYYAYIYARVFAQAIWKELFEADPLSPKAGAEYRRKVLEKGGEVLPRDLIADVLGFDPEPRAIIALIFDEDSQPSGRSESGEVSLDHLRYRHDSDLARLMADKSSGMQDLVQLPL